MEAALPAIKPLGDAIREIVARIVAKFAPEKVIVFGSAARGTADADGDVDLLIVMQIHGSRRQLATDIERSLIGIPVPVDLVVITPEELARDRGRVGTIVRPALREGRVVYERAA